MLNPEKTRNLMLLGITGCLLYVIGDFLFAAIGPGQSTETIGLFTRVAYLDMAGFPGRSGRPPHPGWTRARCGR